MVLDEFDPLDEARRQWLAHELPEPAAMHAAVSIIHVHQLVTNAIDRALRPLGLTFARYEVLMLLGFSERGSLPMTKMGERLLVHPTGITRLVDKLEADGFVTRLPHPDDRRSTLVELSTRGRTVSEEATTVLGQIRFGLHTGDTTLDRLTDLVRQERSAQAATPDPPP